MRQLMLSGGLCCAIAALPVFAGAANTSVTDVVKAVTRAGYVDITEVTLDDGVWEIEAVQDGRAVEVNVSPSTGEILATRPDEPHASLPADALALPKLLGKLNAAGYTDVTELDLERSGWDVECRHNGRRRDLLVDAVTGKVIADRADD